MKSGVRKGRNVIGYDMAQRNGLGKRAYLCERIRSDIAAGVLAPGEKLPSRRVLADLLDVSSSTVEETYRQLVAEGCVEVRERSGHFVSWTPLAARVRVDAAKPWEHEALEGAVGDRRCGGGSAERAGEAGSSRGAGPAAVAACRFDLTGARGAPGAFPLDAWAKALRQTLSRESAADLLAPAPARGCLRLREQISRFVRQTRGIDASPDRIVVASGAQTLYSLVIQLLGRQGTWAVENPGYPRLSSIYRAHGVQLSQAPLDDEGVSVDWLYASEARVAHLMPSHHYPTGAVTSASRRYELLAWASRSEDRYLVEDDYDCEFRLSKGALPPLAGLDAAGRVLYVNTFSKTMGPSFRLAYLVLPPALSDAFDEKLGFYSSTVSTIESIAFARFMEEGHFERHVRRMRKAGRDVRDALAARLQSGPFRQARIRNEDNGLGFLLELPASAVSSGQSLSQMARSNGVAVRTLDQFYAHGGPDRLARARRTIVVDYSALAQADVDAVVAALEQAVFS
ncbi:aminotransferase class I/II-fold pyridoxal phosphate-dependent enzyme [Eggerthellaceae bacterium zg-893]|nr:aminotransferase class I/II-fold pyridoxal phosphate-dependent enzyme [Eggerthellaceae bacterium zg-893]